MDCLHIKANIQASVHPGRQARFSRSSSACSVADSSQLFLFRQFSIAYQSARQCYGTAISSRICPYRARPLVIHCCFYCSIFTGRLKCIYAKIRIQTTSVSLELALYHPREDCVKNGFKRILSIQQTSTARLVQYKSDRSCSMF